MGRLEINRRRRRVGVVGLLGGGSGGRSRSKRPLAVLRVEAGWCVGRLYRAPWLLVVG